MENLPPDACRRIFSMMKGKELARASCVCKPWNNLLQSDEVWRSVFQNLYKDEHVSGEKMKWKDVYVQKCKWNYGEVEENFLEGFNVTACHLHGHVVGVAGHEARSKKEVYGILDIRMGSFVGEECGNYRFKLSRHHDGWVVIPGDHAHSCRVLLWNLETGEKVIRSLNGQGVVSCLDFEGNPPNKIVTGSNSPKIKVWDLAKDECVMTLMTEGKSILEVVYLHQDNRVVAAISRGSGTVVAVFNTQTGEHVNTLPDVFNHLDYLDCVGERLVTFSKGSIRGKVQTWNRENGECSKTLAADTIGTSCFAMDRRIICRATLRAITLWDMDSGQCFRTIDLKEIFLQELGPKDIPSIGSFSGLDFDGNRIVCAFQNGVILILSMRDSIYSGTPKRAPVVLKQKYRSVTIKKVLFWLCRLSFVAILPVLARLNRIG